MRAFGFISLLLSLAIVGYLMVQQMGGPKSEGGGGARIQRAEDSARLAMGIADRKNIETAIANYYSQNQKFPPDLETLLKAGLIEKIPEGLHYNPETGAVTP